jgi:hypothetical protein
MGPKVSIEKLKILLHIDNIPDLLDDSSKNARKNIAYNILCYIDGNLDSHCMV